MSLFENITLRSPSNKRLTIEDNIFLNHDLWSILRICTSSREVLAILGAPKNLVVALYNSSEGVISWLGEFKSPDGVTGRLCDETPNPSGKAFHLSGGTSIKPSGKTYNQVSRAKYWLCPLDVILESGPARGIMKS